MNTSPNIDRQEAAAMNFVCSVCGKREAEPQGWRFIIELDKPGTEIRNTIFIVDRWDASKALDSHAACFCSDACEEQYLLLRHRQLVA